MKCLKSDNEREYIDDDFKWYHAENGIKITKTIPRKPQQNGVAKMMNKTLNESVSSMRIHVGLPKTFWANAVNTAAYVINKGHSVPLDCGIPEEI